MFENTEMTATDVRVDLGIKTPNWKPLYLFNTYRLAMAFFLVGSFFVSSPTFLGEYDEHLFLITGWIYVGFAIFSLLMIEQSWLPCNIQVLGEVLLDIIAITILMHASGGVNAGLGILLVATIAGGSLLTEGRTAFFFAAVASLCILIEVSLADLYNGFPGGNYTHAGMLGISFFATAFLAHILARRVRASEALAKQRGIHLQYLAQLNAQIVQLMQSGIIVVDILGRISLFNEAARRLLGLNEQPNGQTLRSMRPELAEKISIWKKSGQAKSSLFCPAMGEVDIIATFTELKKAGAIHILIVLEDATLTAQRAQQIKLASLGRLTASIAHEIRNPLSAISHAGELLAESPDICQDDIRLTQIITKHSQRVNNIIESVLQLSRRDQANAQCFDLQIWLRAYIDEFIIQQDLNPSDVIFSSHHSHKMVCFDPSQLYQVVGNLCENGLRYSQGTPLLELTIGVSEESNRPYLNIKDQGQGMTSAVKAQIFEPFFTTETNGTGLGLYLAKEICEANQASLHLLSNSSTGCCFSIHFSLDDIQEFRRTGVQKTDN
ncbi:MAG: PAS domain-containing protein [Thiomargarita sp.]|nr:PAS domain-containing protein [Thiomargarita sp.]